MSDTTIGYVTGSGYAVLTRAHQFIADSVAKASDGLSWSEFGELLTRLIRLVAAGLDEVNSMPGHAKKALVVEAVGLLFDAVADRCVPLLAYPVWIVARPAARALMLAVAGGVLEQLLPLMRAVK